MKTRGERRIERCAYGVSGPAREVRVTRLVQFVAQDRRASQLQVHAQLMLAAFDRAEGQKRALAFAHVYADVRARGKVAASHADRKRAVPIKAERSVEEFLVIEWPTIVGIVDDRKIDLLDRALFEIPTPMRDGIASEGGEQTAAGFAIKTMDRFDVGSVRKTLCKVGVDRVRYLAGVAVHQDSGGLVDHRKAIARCEYIHGLCARQIRQNALFAYNAHRIARFDLSAGFDFAKGHKFDVALEILLNLRSRGAWNDRGEKAIETPAIKPRLYREFFNKNGLARRALSCANQGAFIVQFVHGAHASARLGGSFHKDNGGD